MTTYCRVEMPVLDVVPIRKAEPGMELETSAFDRNGRPIAEAGAKLSQNRIDQLKNLDVRKIVISSPVERWMSQENVRSSHSSVTVLEEKEFEEAAADIAESVQSADGAKSLRKTAQFLRQEANQAGDTKRAERLGDIIDRTYELEEQLKELTERIRTVDGEENREKLQAALDKTIKELDELYMEVNAPESVIQSTLDSVSEKDEIRNDLMDYLVDHADQLQSAYEIELEPKSVPGASETVNTLLENPVEGIDSVIKHYDLPSDHVLHKMKEMIQKESSIKKNLMDAISSMDLDLEHRKLLKDVLQGRKSVQRKELLTLPIPQKVAEKTYTLTQQEIESRTNLWHAVEDVTNGALSKHLSEADFIVGTRHQPDSDSEPDGEDVPDAVPDEVGGVDSDLVYKLLGDIERGDVAEGVEAFTHDYEGDPRQEAQLTNSASRLQSLAEERESLRETVRKELEDPDEILAMLDREQSFDPYVLLEYDLDSGLREKLANNINETDREYRSVWDGINEVTDGTLYEGSDSERIDDKIESARRVVHSQRNEPEEEPEDEDVETILQTRESHEIANEFDMEIATVENAREFMQMPSEMSSEQQLYLDPLIEETRKIFYDKSFDDDRMAGAADELADHVVDHKRPMKMLLEPPTGEKYLLTHTINTCTVCLSLADHFSFDSGELLDVTAASLSVDFGMIEVPTKFWTRQDDLTDRGDREVRRHPTHSRSIVSKAVNGDHVVQDLVHQHHERPDGSGYPEGLDDNDMHTLAPLIGVADAYAAMLENRPYRSARSPAVALKTLMKNGGSYDTSVVKALADSIGLYPNGSVVLLSDGRLALVKSQSASPVKPIVLILTDEDQNRLNSPSQLSLSESDTTIKKTLKW